MRDSVIAAGPYINTIETVKWSRFFVEHDRELVCSTWCVASCDDSVLRVSLSILVRSNRSRIRLISLKCSKSFIFLVASFSNDVSFNKWLAENEPITSQKSLVPRRSFLYLRSSKHIFWKKRNILAYSIKLLNFQSYSYLVTRSSSFFSATLQKQFAAGSSDIWAVWVFHHEIYMWLNDSCELSMITLEFNWG